MTDETRISTVSLRFDALHIGEGELKLDLQIYAVTARWGIIRGGGTISRSLDPPVPPTQVRVTGMFQSLDDGLHFHVSGRYSESGGGQGPFNASGAVDHSWNGRGAFVYHNFDSGPCVIIREGEQ